LRSQESEEPKRGTLERLRRAILEVVPEAEQVISYRVPANSVGWEDGRRLRRLQEPPELSAVQRGSVLQRLVTKSALHFPVDRPPPKTLVRKLVTARLSEIRRPQ
jgi:hypothetical protein